MEFSNETNQIEWYLNKNYYVKEHKFFTKLDNQHVWGFAIAEELPTILSINGDVCVKVFTKWAYDNDLDEKSFHSAWGARKLKATWSPEIPQDLQVMYGITSAEEQLTRMLADEIAVEIDGQILRDLREQITPNNFFGLVKCLGYETTPTMFDPTNFKPRKGFISTSYNEMINERQNNPLWQDWIRAREQD